MIVRLISTAQTGYFYTTQRLRTGPRLAAVKYDPQGASTVLNGGVLSRRAKYFCFGVVGAVKRRVLFVEGKKSKK